MKNKLMNNQIKNLFTCPSCSFEFKIKENKLICTDCGNEYEIDDNLIDFGVKQQRFVNNWGGTADEDEAMEWITNLIEEGYLIEEDLQWLQKNVNEDAIESSWKQALEEIRGEYYNPDNDVIVDLASGMGSVFNNGMDFKKLEGKTVILTDLSRKILEDVRDRLKEKTQNINMIYAVCDVGNLPLKDNSVDFISSVGVFANAFSGKDILGELKRILKPSKRFKLFEFLNIEGSRSQKLKEKIANEDILSTVERFKIGFEEIDLKKFEIDKLYEGVAHMEGDLLPLKDEKGVWALIRAVNCQ
ncbi:MAG: class I SAM-dependent methyltransferase [Candidatus Mcinerneyibacterium aminivorans]|uniref:Class I SAM-dependent methyltransferase n=1 Tax=Candidatus Mcinerneyibacterium aminivorans TaxID=2703815 RepID=A0A5D0MCS7_9BACT|nr:MAG: class I SAM-dependent methyltransferase [Candidatus Mcinerneyibacterium aminivorans]